MPLLSLDRERRDRTGIQATQRDRFPGLDAIAVAAVLDARERRFDLGDQLSLTIAGPELDRTIRFGRCAIGDIGMIFAFVLKRREGLLAFGEYRFAPSDQLSAENTPSAVRS